MIIALLVACLLFKNSVIQIKKRCGTTNNKTQSFKNTCAYKSPKLKTKHLESYKRLDLATMSKKGTSELPSTDETDANDIAKTVLKFKDSAEATSLDICGKNVRVITSSGTHTHGSSKVKLKTVVDYKWETKHYPGHLIAVHINGDYVAYVIVNNKANRMEGMIRVMQLSSSSRVLIKGMSGEILDVQFAYIWEEVLLASIDANSLYIHRIFNYDSNLKSCLVLQIEDPLQNYTPAFDKICWCHFLPREDDIVEPDEKHLIIWARGSRFQGFYVNTIVNDLGERKVTPDQITIGYRVLVDNSTVIRWIAISPDGTTVCIGSSDGYIRFYQLYMFDKEWRCLHLWKPHDGKPISSCFFLDNLKENYPEIKYWKYAITGANNNTELKLWDCGTWTCLQTINLCMEIEKPNSTLRFIAEMDATAEYLVLSSLETKSCYVLQIENNTEMSALNTEIKKDKSPVAIKSIAEFPLSSGILSFAIRDSAVRRYKSGSDSFLCDELFEFDDENNSVCCVVVRLLLVQSKSVQECSIIYHPNVIEPIDIRASSLLTDSASKNLKDKLENSSNSIVVSKSNFDETSSDKTDKPTETDIIKKEKGKVLNPLQVLFGLTSNSNNNIVANDNNESHTNTNSNNPSKTSFFMSGSTPLINNTNETKETIAVSPKPVTPANASTNPNSSSNANSNSNSNSASSKNPNQVNLMTPDSFTAKSTPDSAVSSDVLNTILMLANATKQQTTPNATALKSEANLFDILNNKLKDPEQEPKKPAHIVADSVEQQKKFPGNNLFDMLNHKLKEDQDQTKIGKIADPVDPQKKFVAIDHNPICDNLTSGGSSPSREVQEIMSLQEFEKSGSSSCEDEDGIGEQTFKADDVLDVNEDESLKTSPSSKTSASTIRSNWNNEVNILTNKHSSELQNAASLIPQTVATAITNHCTIPMAPAQRSTSNSLVNGTATETTSELSDKLDKILDLVSKQSATINSLQNDIAELKKTNAAAISAASTTATATATAAAAQAAASTQRPATPNKAFTEFSYKLELQITKMIEQYMKRMELEHNKRMASALGMRETKIHELRDTLMQTLEQFLHHKLSGIVFNIINVELQRNLLPKINSKIDEVRLQFKADIAQKINHFDGILKENIAQACKNKAIIDAFGKSVLVGVQSSLQSAFIESMSSTLIPAYEKSSQNMFQQLHDAFSVGMKEFMEQFDTYIQQLRPVRSENHEELFNNLSASLRETMEKIMIEHNAGLTEGLVAVHKDVRNIDVTLARNVNEIKAEIRKGFNTQVAALRSQANTPAPQYDAREAIRTLLNQGQINKAFHQALLANDLELVEFTLKTADHISIFTPECKLEQKVLLSLMQQISADMMNSHNDLKQNYLTDALLAINLNDPISKEHAPEILNDVYRKCQMFLIHNPKSPQFSNVRILLKAIQSVNKENFY